MHVVLSLALNLCWPRKALKRIIFNDSRKIVLISFFEKSHFYSCIPSIQCKDDSEASNENAQYCEDPSQKCCHESHHNQLRIERIDFDTFLALINKKSKLKKWNRKFLDWKSDGGFFSNFEAKRVPLWRLHLAQDQFCTTQGIIQRL